MNSKYINKGLNADKNQIISKNKNNTIKNFHDINNNIKPKPDKIASNYGNSETYEKNKNFNMNRNLNSNNHNVFQKNYNLHHEKGSNVNSNSDSGFNKIERGGGGIVNNIKISNYPMILIHSLFDIYLKFPILPESKDNFFN